ncbi:MAG: hypothetical protein KAX80_10470, partial [Planctomycetes bacterium]|nr:hypothetical protein [Planctomycetota bacterium]
AGHTTLGSPDIWQDIKNALDAITNFFKMVWDAQRGWYWPPTDRLYHALAGTWDAVLAFPSTIYQYFLGEYSPLVMWVDRLSDWWRYEIKPRFDAVKNAIVGFPSTIYQYFLGEYSPLVMWVDRLSDWWRDVAGPNLAAVVNGIWAIPYEIYLWFFGEYSYLNAWVDRLSAWWRTDARPWVEGAVNAIKGLPWEIFNWLFGEHSYFNAWVDRISAWWHDDAKPWLQARLDPINEMIAGGWPFIIDQFSLAFGPGRKLSDPEHRSVLDHYKPIVQGWFDEFAAIPKDWLTRAAEIAGTNLALEPSRSLDVAGHLYGRALAAGTGAHVVATALNAIPTLNWVGASQLAAFVAEGAGFEAITRATYGTFLDGALAWPMRYHWNQLLRPKIPTEGAIYAMGRKRGLDYAEFSKAMAYHGLPQEWIDKEYLFFWADPSPYWLLRMSEQATPSVEPHGLMREWYDKWVPGWQSDPWGWYRAKLKMAGFEDSDIQPFIDGFQRRRVAPAITRLKTAIRHMSREAYWDDWKVRDELSTLGVREDEITYLIDAERLQRQNDYLDDQVRYYNESFRKGEISAQGLSIVLSTIIVKP